MGKSVMKKRVSYIVILGFVCSAAGLTFGCRTVCGDLSDQLEPNDSIGEATPLSYGRSIDAGSHYGNVDFFKIDVAAPATLQIRLDSRDKVARHAMIELRSPSGKLLYTDVCPVDQAGCAPDLEASKVSLRGDDGVIVGYVLEVVADELGDYSIQVQATGSDHVCNYSWEYTLVVTKE